nr:hypothetical protein [Tanacetum cinerariifolium]
GAILKLRNKLRPHLVHKIGNGTRTLMWHDQWNDIGHLSKFVSYKTLYYARTDSLVTIDDMTDQGKQKWPKEWIEKFPTLVDEMKRLIINGKVTLVVDEGKPLAKVDSLDDHYSEDEVASVDNDMTVFGFK